MHVEYLLILSVLGFACLPFARSLIRRPAVLVGVLGLLVIMGTARWKSFQSRTQARVRAFDRLAADLPHLSRKTEYVSSNRCRSCHPAEHASWHRTYHRTMTQVALPENVLGAFDDTTIWSDGLAYRVFREADEFWAEMPDPDEMMYVVQGGKPLAVEAIPRVRRRVVLTTGSHHYQTYWVAGDKKYGRLLQTLPLVYLIRDQRWIPREAAFMRAPIADSGRMITQWNHHCIQCHSTGGIPGLDKEGRLDTRVGEMGIACEACHGPGEEHIRRNADPAYRYRMHLSDTPDPTIINPAKLDHRRGSQVCGQCHGVYIRTGEFGMTYAQEGILYRPGEDLHRTRYYIRYPREGSPPDRWEELRLQPQFFHERWWEDGTMMVTGREYTALLGTGCYTRGQLSCFSCHSMHDSPPEDQLKPKMRTGAACTQCHDEPEYTDRVTNHTFHAPDSSGSNCLNCHMPHTTYGLFSAIRNHQIESPNITASIRHGVPNACNLCHLDQTLAWAQDYTAQWYGHEKQPLSNEQKTISAALLWLLKGHAAQRAITAWHVGWAPAQTASGADWLAPFQARLLADPYGVVRYVAKDNLKKLPGFADFTYDFLAPADELERQVDEAITRWRRTRAEPLSRTGERVLIDDQGNIVESKVQTLLRQRDNRPVTLKE